MFTLALSTSFASDEDDSPRPTPGLAAWHRQSVRGKVDGTTKVSFLDKRCGGVSAKALAELTPAGPFWSKLKSNISLWEP